MEAATFERSLRAFSRRRPFRPFVVELVSGTSLVIEHPEALVFGTKVAVYVDKDNDITIFDNDGVSKMTSKKRNSAAD